MQASKSHTLPQPDPDSSAHSKRCAAYIHERIDAAGGSISFAEFMQHALYSPGLGYYTAGATKFGAAGDFVTAPEVSSLFGRVLARQCAEVLAQTSAATLMEIGAGSGRLAQDLLKKLAELDTLPDQYFILEASADLQDRQQQRFLQEIPEFSGRVRWLDELPRNFGGVVVANEVLDSMPVERFVRRDAIYEQRVVWDQDRFAIVEDFASGALTVAVEALERDLGVRFPDGYESEVSLAAPAWAAQIVTSVKDGVVFLFDYGLSQREYYALDRSGGWLRCHFRHRAHSDALILPGIQDITAWVDFSAIATAAVGAGAEIAGYVDQAHFLLGGGLDAELAMMSSATTVAGAELSAQVKMLTLPENMGEHFKCMGLARGMNTIPSALQLADRTHTL